LYVDDKVIGYIADGYIQQKDLPHSLEIQKSYSMQQ